MKTLNDTVALMNSADYKERFAAEYYQLETRYNKLGEMLDKWRKNELDFTPTCPRAVLTSQYNRMKQYLKILITRASIEDIELEIDVKFDYKPYQKGKKNDKD